MRIRHTSLTILCPDRRGHLEGGGGRNGGMGQDGLRTVAKKEEDGKKTKRHQGRGGREEDLKNKKNTDKQEGEQVESKTRPGGGSAVHVGPSDTIKHACTRATANSRMHMLNELQN